MKSPFGLRLWLLIAALLVMAGGIIYGLSSAWRHVQELEAILTSSRIESFRMAGEVERGLLNLHNSMLRFVMLRDPEHWARFEMASADLDRWIDHHDPSHNPKSPLTSDQAQRMRELAQQLADAHRAAEAGFLAKANASLANLQNILAVSVGILLALVAAMGWVIYRDMVAPLRTKLVQSQVLLEKQEKLEKLATLGTLAAGIAHEIRNPLTSLKARLYTLEKHLQSLPAARKDTDIISAEISRLERIVQDVLSFARPSEPKLETVAADNPPRSCGLGETSGYELHFQLAGLKKPLFTRSGLKPKRTKAFCKANPMFQRLASYCCATHRLQDAGDVQSLTGAGNIIHEGSFRRVVFQ